MESSSRIIDREAVRACFEKIKKETLPADVINTVLLVIMFAFYTLTFFVPRFYGLTEKYVGLFNFAVLSVMFIVNIRPLAKLKSKDKEMIALALTVVVTLVNIVLVGSGFGCFFVVVNFAMIWYMAGTVRFLKWQRYFFGILYLLMVIYWFAGVYTWMFADYTSFAMNTNTAATFTVFSMLCVFVLFDFMLDRFPVTGLLITVALIKCLQIALYHRSRGAFILIVVFFVLRFIVPARMWERKWFFRSMCIFATLGSLVFVAAYVWLGTTGANFRMPFFYKNVFSGREAIWLEFWNLFRARPLTGIGTNVTITSFMEFNVHNAMYNILVIHGVIVFALVLYIMFARWEKIRPALGTNRAVRCAFVAILAVCIESFTDVDLIWTDYTMNMIFLLFVMSAGSGRGAADGQKE